MADSALVLFDLPSKGKTRCWSMNAWKARLVLNYKQIPYETRWTEYPEIEPLFTSLGVPPNPVATVSTPYSIPAVRLPDGRYIMDSARIAETLEKLQPSPSLHLASPRICRTQEAVKLTDTALTPISKTRVPDLLLRPGSVDYFQRTRAERFGMPLGELAKSEKAGEAAWATAGEGITKLREILAEKSDGPYVEGAAPGFADFVLAGFWRFLQLLEYDGDLLGRLIKYDESFQKHLDACGEWLSRDD